MRLLIGLGMIVLLLSPARAWGIGEIITDVQIQADARTEEETIRSLAGVNIGDELRMDTLEKVRERLNTAGLFSDVNVYWRPHSHGVQVVITVKDKFPWAPVPTFSSSPGNISLGLFLAHGNLFGRGKRGLMGARYSNVDSNAIVVYEDPALFGSWLFLNLRGKAQDQVLPEFSNREDLPVTPIRETKMRSFAGGVNLGVSWFRKVRTSIGWFGDNNFVRKSEINADNPFAPAGLPPPAIDAVRSGVSANLTFDFRAREHAVMYGNALSLGAEHASSRLGSDDTIDYWKVSAFFEQGFRVFRRHNLILAAGGYVGDRLPFWAENANTGNNLRGFLYRQYAGDVHLRTMVEYHFPLFSIKKVDLRGLVFNDGAALWYRKLPPMVGGTAYETRPDGRNFLPPDLLVPGFDAQRDVHTSFGVGLRFFLRSVAAPLVGIDVAHGVDTGTVRLVIVVGA